MHFVPMAREREHYGFGEEEVGGVRGEERLPNEASFSKST
jgi:hypothetical protein